MKIKQIKLHHISMKLKSAFKASNATYDNRECIIIEMVNEDGLSGWGECSAFNEPYYTEETIKTAWHVLTDFLIPMIFKASITHPTEIHSLFNPIRRHFMAKASIESAIWDLFAKENNISLSKLIGGTRTQIPSGAAVGLMPFDELSKTIENYLEDGYKRIKVKIKPSHDLELIKEIRNHFPNLPLMADANAAYTKDDIDALKQLDDYDLMMIEQPFRVDDLIDHATLQAQMKTPICLDESIETDYSMEKAIELGSCKVVNLKMARVGGYYHALKINDICAKNNINVWCGGLLETGIGRAHNIAIASLQNFSLPGDISASSRYWTEDIIEPEIVVEKGMVKVPTQCGIGVAVSRKKLEKFTLKTETFMGAVQN